VPDAWARLVRERGGAPLGGLEDASAFEPGSASFVAILRHDDEILPAVARLCPERAAVELLLSVGDPLPGDAASVANRLEKALSTSSTRAYVMNTGLVGGEGERRKIGEDHGAAILDAIAAGSIEWESDPDFGYETAESVPGIEGSDRDVLSPRYLYSRTERPYTYAEIVERLRREAAELIGGLDGLEPRIAAAAPLPVKRGRRDVEDDEP
jgi:phosphoenolpyruvate carboxykinase (ATP)